MILFVSERTDTSGEEVKEDISRLGRIFQLGHAAAKQYDQAGKSQSLSPSSGRLLMMAVSKKLIFLFKIQNVLTHSMSVLL